MNKYSIEFYDGLQKAYDFFNQELFDNELPQCMILLQRKNNAAGYYRKNTFTNSNNENISEIALNPDCFYQPIKEILSTLAHEQSHLLCDIRGYVSRKGFHSQKWCEVMKGIGLQPVDPRTGQDCDNGGAKMTDRIIERDIFDLTCDRLLETVKFDLTNIKEIKEKKEKKVTKFVYICPECDLEISAKVDTLNIICGECSQQLKLADQ